MLVLSLDETCITNGNHAAIIYNAVFLLPMYTCITNGVFLYIIADNSWYIDALGISHA